MFGILFPDTNYRSKFLPTIDVEMENKNIYHFYIFKTASPVF